MLKINLGLSEQYCDGVSRRSFLKLGSLTLGGAALGGMTSLSLPQLLAAQAHAPARSARSAQRRSEGCEMIRMRVHC